MKIILQMERDFLETLQYILKRAQCIEESPSTWELSFANQRFQKFQKVRIYHATVAQTRKAAVKEWPITIEASGHDYQFLPPFPEDEISHVFAFSLKWVDAIGKNWKFSTSNIAGRGEQEWKKNAGLRLRWLSFSHKQCEQLLEEACIQVAKLKRHQDEAMYQKEIMDWFHGKGLIPYEKTPEPVYDSSETESKQQAA